MGYQNFSFENWRKKGVKTQKINVIKVTQNGNETTGVDWTKDSGHTFIRGTVFDGEKTPAPQEEHSKDELLAELKALYEKYS
jgi:hypothetical protein